MGSLVARCESLPTVPPKNRTLSWRVHDEGSDEAPMSREVSWLTSGVLGEARVDREG